MTDKKMAQPALQELLKNILPQIAGVPQVFLGKAPANAKAPYIVMAEADDGERFRTINGPSGLAQPIYRIDVYSPGYYSAQAISNNIETALDGYRGIVYHGEDSPQAFTRIAGISLETGTELVDETDDPVLYRKTKTYRVTFEQ